MTIEDLQERIGELASHILFTYNGIDCGIDPISAHAIDMWYGDDGGTYDSLDAAMRVPIFDGKCLKDIVGDIKLESWQQGHWR